MLARGLRNGSARTAPDKCGPANRAESVPVAGWAGAYDVHARRQMRPVVCAASPDELAHARGSLKVELDLQVSLGPVWIVVVVVVQPEALETAARYAIGT